MTDIATIQHPNFVSLNLDYRRWRSTFEGGRQFVETYLVKFSARETTDDFSNRKKITYVPAHAKAAVIDVRNAIFQRMADVIRRGGSSDYQQSVQGNNRGVDLKGNSMNSFLGRFILPELLVLGRVGIYVDRPELQTQRTLATPLPQPYLYYYQAEDIRSWHYNEIGELDSVLVEDHFFGVDNDTGLVNREDSHFRLMTLEENGVRIRFFKKDSTELVQEEKLLALTRIPFVILELTNSLLEDIADYQIALLNMGSSDVNYVLKANYPFYTEQYAAGADLLTNRQGQVTGTAAEGATSQTASINVGVTQGRRYPKGIERPGFIHPSSEPLIASMEKQDRMIAEIRQLINLALTNIKAVRASAESKQIDNQGLEAGLSYIGLELEFGEREIAKIWTEYEGNDEVPHIKYPDNYQLRTDADRRAEASELEKLKNGTPSATYKKEICKQIARVTVGAKVPIDVLTKIEQEIEKADVVETNFETIRSDHEAGFVSTKTASEIRGYPAGEAEQAEKDHASRLARIAASQSQGGFQSRGVADAGTPTDGSDEKTESRNVDKNANTQPPVRGEANA